MHVFVPASRLSVDDWSLHILSVIPKLSVIRAKMVEVNAVLLSVFSVVGRYACLVKMSMMTFATLIADALRKRRSK